MKRMRRNISTLAVSARRNALLCCRDCCCCRAGFCGRRSPTGSPLAPLPSAESVINRNTDNFSGSIPQGKATAETIDLTIEDALDRGLKYNLGLYLSDQTTAEARAARLQSLSALLPNINGTFAEEVAAHQPQVLRLQVPRLSQFGRTFRFDGDPGHRHRGAC